MEGKTEGKRGKCRPRRNYLDQMKDKINVVSYQDVERLSKEEMTVTLTTTLKFKRRIYAR